MVDFDKYLEAIQDSVNHPVFKIEFLDEQENTKMIITDDVISSGKITGENKNGIRRTASLTLFNKNNKYSVSPDGIWYNQKVRIEAGIQARGETFWFPQGIFYIEEPSINRTSSSSIIELKLVDKWGALDGSVYGKLPYNVQFLKEIKKTVGDQITTVDYEYNMYDIIKSILGKNRRYDVNIIDYIPDSTEEFVSGQFNRTGLNNILKERLNGGLKSITPLTNFIMFTKSNNIYRCVSNVATTGDYSPVWELYSLDERDVLDNTPPILDTYYFPVEKDGKWYLTEEDSFDQEMAINKEKLPYGLLTLPSNLIATRGESEADLLVKMATILSAEIGYNVNGQMFVIPTGRQIKYEEKQVVHRFKYSDYVYSVNDTYEFVKTVNHVVAVMTMANGVVIQGIASNENLASDYCVQKIGVFPYIYEFDYAYRLSDFEDSEAGVERQLNEFAKWYLDKYSMLQNSKGISCPFLPHIKEGEVIELQRADGIYEKFLINEITIPVNYSLTMDISCTNLTALGVV